MLEKKKLLAVSLSIIMMLMAFPLAAMAMSAAEQFNIQTADTSIIRTNWEFDDTSGILFIGNIGTVLGKSVTPMNSFIIPANHTLTINAGQTLTINNGITLTSFGTIAVNGTFMNNGTIDGDGTIT